MRKIIATVLILVILLIASFVFLPFFTGLQFQRNYTNLIAAYNQPQAIEINIQSYKRTWFRSQSELHVVIYKNQLSGYAKLFGLDDASLPSQLEFNVLQNIKHGPVIYFMGNRLSFAFGSALIKSKVSLSPTTKTFLNRLGLDDNFIRKNESVLSFFGNYFTHLTLGSLNLNYPKNNTHFGMDAAIFDVWFYPNKMRLKTKMKVDGLKWVSNDAHVSIPQLSYQFDQTKNPINLWLGKFGINLNKLAIKDSTGQGMALENITLQGKSSVSSDKLKANRALDIDEITFENQKLGPFHFEIVVRNLNATAIANMINSYQEIMQRGELYQSQLQNKLLNIFPNIFPPGAEINFKELSLDTTYGNFLANLQLTWPQSNSAPPEDLSDFTKNANLNAYVNISKNLLNKIVDFLSALPQFQGQDEAQVKKLQEMRETLDDLVRENSLLVLRIVELGGIPKNTGEELLLLQKEGLSQAYYNDLRSLFLTRKVSKDIAYLLYWQYAAVELQTNAIKKELEVQSDTAKQMIMKSMSDWVSKGYLVSTNDSYETSLTREGGAVKLNDKPYEP